MISIPASSQAVIFDGQQGQLRLQDLAIPSLKSGEMLVKVDSCTLCGSDLHSIDCRRKVPIPTVLGHEIVGTLVDFDASLTPRDMFGNILHIGDRITWAIVANCGECYYCVRELPQKCLNGIKYGHEAIGDRSTLSGGLAEYCILARGTKAIQVDRAMPLGKICPASCATATIAAMFDAAQQCQANIDQACDLSGKTVCIIGAGMLGLTAAAMASWQNAMHIIVVDVNMDRLELAKQFGASCTTTPDDLKDLLAIITGGFGADIVLELSGAEASFSLGFESLRTGGALILAGAVFPVPPVSLLMEQVIRRQLTIRGVHNYAPKHLARGVEFLTATDMPFENLVSPWLTLAELPGWLSQPRVAMPIRVGISFPREL